ncbi:CLUMA_CG010810, isoform A [Clunio marinus]|uniref:CLUMA_CG010810, isoform A n=1 Tax=Clunio marinus TaxID=568069 RepID=A0A1J1IAV8_9DIPT|nr:CLUMA_CG010810, isoform A [Clunio marinus]
MLSFAFFCLHETTPISMRKRENLNQNPMRCLKAKECFRCQSNPLKIKPEREKRNNFHRDFPSCHLTR